MENPPPPFNQDNQGSRPFLGVNFVNCRIYSRLYRNAEGTAYEGRCPRCGQFFRIKIGREGTPQRFFQARCRKIDPERWFV